jgi:AraC-like DNA-binding protein
VSPIRQLKPTEFFPDPQFRLRVMPVPAHGPMQEQHRHSFEELVIILDGQAKHQVGRESYDIAAGDVFVLLGEMSHCYPEVRKLSLINVLYDPGHVRLPRADLGTLPGYHALFRVEPTLRQHQHFQNRLKLSFDELGRLANMVAELDEEVRGRAPGYRFMATMHFMEIVGFLSRCYSRIPSRDVRPVTQISDLLSYIEQHYTQPLAIDDLVRAAHMSHSTLYRTFRQIMGRSPIDYLIHLRVGKAAQLLQRSTMRVREISDAVGFSDSNYFTRQFRAITGVSPREYRDRRLYP